MNRRDFLQFLGATGVTLALFDLESCSHHSPISGLKPSTQDKIITAEGLEHKIMIKWEKPLTHLKNLVLTMTFWRFHPLSEGRGILWVNHEYVHPLFIEGFERTKAISTKKEKKLVEV